MIKSRKSDHFIFDLVGTGLFYTPFLIFIVLLSLCFFAHPAAEDLSIYHYDHVLGLKEFISRLYHQNCSRYFSFPLILILCDGDFVPGHYYVMTLLLLLAFWGLLFFFMRVFTDRSLAERVSGKWCAWLSMLILLAVYSIMFQASGIFYWLSGAMTYLLSFLLFAWLMILLLRSTGPAILCMLLAIAITGSNEIALYFLVISLLWGQFLYSSVTGKRHRLINLLLGTVFLCFIFIIVPGGTAHRAGNFKIHFPVAKGMLVATGYTGRVFLRALGSSWVWLCMALAVLAGALTKEHIRSKLARSFFFRPQAILLLILLAVFGFYFLIYVLSGELLPPRANDLMLFYVFFFLLLSGYAYGIRAAGSLSFIQSLYRQRVLRLFIFLILITNPLLYSGIRNVLLGIIYQQVMMKREEAIRAAGRRGLHKVILNRYEKDFDDISGKWLPVFLQTRLARIGDRYPGLVHYQDPLADTALYIHYYAEYNHIDTIEYDGLDYARIGLMEKNTEKKGL